MIPLTSYLRQRHHLENNEADFIFLLSTSLVLFTYLLAGFLLHGNGYIFESGEHYVFILSIAALPPASVWIASSLRARFGNQWCASLREWNIDYLILLTAYVIVVRVLATWDLINGLSGRIFSGAPLLHIAGFLIRTHAGYRASSDPNDSAGVGVLIGIVLVLCIVFSPLEFRVIETYLTSLDWTLGLIAAALLTGLVCWTARRCSTSTGNRIATALALILVTMTFDPNMAFDYYHYIAYIGPAISITHGAIPLVDTISQYGVLPPVLFSLFFQIAAESFYAGGLLVAITTVAWVLIFAAITFHSTTNKWLAAGGVVLFVWFHQTAIGYNLNMTPSTVGMRYLPDMLMLWSLSRLKPGEGYRWHSILALVVASFWSVEALGFCTATYTAFLFARGIFVGHAWSRIGLQCAVPAAVVCVAHAGFMSAVFLWKGKLPEFYEVYLELVRGHEENTYVGWTHEIPPNYCSWIGILGIYLAALVYFWKSRIWDVGRALSWTYIAVIFPATVMGLAESAIFVWRSLTTMLVTAAFPLGIVVIVSLDQLARSTWNGLHIQRTARNAALVVAVIFLSVILVRFTEPLEVYRGNSTMLRACLSVDGCRPGKFVSEWKAKLGTPSYLQSFPPNHSAWGFGFYRWPVKRGVIPDGVMLVRKYAAGLDRVILFLNIEDNAVLLYTGKRHRLSISHNLVDAFSRTLAGRIVEEARGLTAGELMIVSAGRTADPLVDKVFSAVKSHLELCVLERTSSGLTAYRLVDAGHPCPASSGGFSSP